MATLEDDVPYEASRAEITCELRTLFEEWLAQLEAEVLEFLKGRETASPEDVADHFNLSKESAVFLLSKLVREGKIKISAGGR